MITFNKYLSDCSIHFNMHSNRGIRFGQFLFNELHRIKPELANLVRGTDSDPFYASLQSDSRIINFLEKTEQLWETF